MSIIIKGNKHATLSPNQYVAETQVKTQAVIHHTVGSGNPFNTVAGWNKTPARVATALIIAGKEDATKAYKNGQVYQVYPIFYYGWHVNVTTKGLSQQFRLDIEKRTIGIEICNYGQLIKRNNKYYAVINNTSEREIPVSEVCDLGYQWRGSRYYHAYTDEQIESLRLLLLELGEQYEIPLRYNDLFNINKDAIRGKSGIWGHCNYRLDKSDVSPQPKLIKMLQSLAPVAVPVTKDLPTV